MSRDQALAWYTEMLWAAVTAATPVVLTVVVVGLVIAIVQAATQVNDQAVAFGPKAFAAILALTVAGSFIIAEVGDFTTPCLEGLASVGAALRLAQTGSLRQYVIFLALGVVVLGSLAIGLATRWVLST